MIFFIPHAADRDEAEQIWAGVRLWLSDLGLPTTRRRIRALSLEIDGVAPSAARRPAAISSCSSSRQATTASMQPVLSLVEGPVLSVD